jgi:hypothetical protein
MHVNADNCIIVIGAHATDADMGYKQALALMNHRTYYGSRKKAGLLGPEDKR